MGVFGRNLDVGGILKHVESNPEGAVAALLENWVPPGDRPKREGKLGLRLALRDGYVNFYVSGQSVAKLTSWGGRLEIETHWKYHHGVHKGTAAQQPGKLYACFNNAELDSLTAEDVQRWTEAAESYASAEKTFVERLLVTNSNVVDLETALPGPTAPRMDLAVVFERGKRLTIGFWEAKCVDNGELRASTTFNAETREGGPRVFAQAEKYRQWLSDATQLRDVQEAYRNTGRVLRDMTTRLVKLNGGRYWQLERLDGRIQRLADEAPEVVLSPGLVVGAYCPPAWLRRHPQPQAPVTKFANCLSSFRKGEDQSHEAELQKHFANYVCFDKADGKILPDLNS